MKKFILLLMFVFGLVCTKAQVEIHKMVTIGYEYQNMNFGEVGGKLLFLSQDDFLVRAGASALMGASKGDFVILPKAQIDFLLNTQKERDVMHGYYFMGGVEATTKHIAPKVGLAVLGILDLTAGYGFSLDNKGIHGKELKGFTMNFTINIPLVAIHDLTK